MWLIGALSGCSALFIASYALLDARSARAKAHCLSMKVIEAKNAAETAITATNTQANNAEERISAASLHRFLVRTIVAAGYIATAAATLLLIVNPRSCSLREQALAVSTALFALSLARVVHQQRQTMNMRGLEQVQERGNHMAQRSLQVPAAKASMLSTRDIQRLSPHFSGRWRKDRSASSDMDHPTRMMQMSAPFRKAINLLSRAESELDDNTFIFKLGSEIPWFRIEEKMRTDGGESYCKRRDLRRGTTSAWLRTCQDQLIVEMQWEDPIGGQEVDTFSLEDNGNRMNVDCKVHLNSGASFDYRLSWVRDG